jgi:uncharacterized linocin/CFP29 family protein
MKGRKAMDILKRSIAPITDAAWSEIDAQARRVLHALLSARKLVDVEGPRGWEYASVPLGRLEVPGKQGGSGVDYGVHRVLPLVETRAYFDLQTWELDNIVRGALDIDFTPLEKAAQEAARFEEEAVFKGFSPSGIRGLGESTLHKPVSLTGDPENLLESVSQGITALLGASVEGPYGLAVSPEIWRHLAGYVRGYPLRNHLEKLLGGPVVLGQFIDGAYLLSLRGGDMQLVIGQDLSIGYLSHDSRTVHLYFTESFTFRVLEPAVIVRMDWKK